MSGITPTEEITVKRTTAGGKFRCGRAAWDATIVAIEQQLRNFFIIKGSPLQGSRVRKALILVFMPARVLRRLRNRNFKNQKGSIGISDIKIPTVSVTGPD